MEDSPTPAGYFLAIGLVLGATWFMPPYPLVFLIAPLLLLVAIPFLLILVPRAGRGKPIKDRF
jgi:hypothetical protein